MANSAKLAPEKDFQPPERCAARGAGGVLRAPAPAVSACRPPRPPVCAYPAVLSPRSPLYVQ